MKQLKDVSRREFLGQISCAGMGYMTLMNSLINLKAMNAAAISNSSAAGYKAIVCILQAGGNDSFNTLIPRSFVKYNEYATTRSNLAIPQGDILPLYPTNNLGGHEYGVHPVMGGVQGLFNNGNLSFVSNIGTLMEPTNKTQYLAKQNDIPLGLFSHSDQIQQWQTAIMDKRTAIGWGGRMADLINDQGNSGKISMNVTLSGTNIFQSGNNTVEYAINENGSIGMNNYGNTGHSIHALRTAAIDNMISQNYQDIFKNTFINTIETSRDAHVEFTTALNAFNDPNNPPFADNRFTQDNPVSMDLKMIASTIGMKDDLGFERQIFFLNFGGWDHHKNLLDSQDRMLGQLSDALAEFYAGLEDIGMENDVLTFTTSEFGRTLTSNGDGSDHAWGGNVMVMGGPDLLHGKQIFGTYPSLAINGPDIVGSTGVVLPTTATDSYFAEIAKWFDVPSSELNSMFPQLSEFYNVNSPNYPIGFIK